MLRPIVKSFGGSNGARVAGRASPSRTTARRIGGRRWNSASSAPASGHKPFVERSDGLKPHLGPRAKITHDISSLSPEMEGEKVILGGWLFAQRRASSTLHFFTLRSGSSSVQLVSRDMEISKRLMNLPLESVIQVEGIIRQKKAKKTGESSSTYTAAADSVEVDLAQAILLNPAQEILPFYPNRSDLASEELKAQYRYLDLRRDELAENLKLRSRVGHIVRCHLHEQGFTEIETPILLSSSPEGAREFLVPTRSSTSTSQTSVHPQPTFYALQQSPQQPKQLLIASGAVPRYFQLARCFRDEDGRKDRQPEFTQIDLEMGFVSGSSTQGGEEGGMRSTWGIGGGEVRDVAEGLVKRIWREVKGEELEGWFRVMPYEVAMDVYGSDKPDTRFEMYTLPIGYYPTLSDEAVDKVLLDQSMYTTEWMITPAEHAARLDVAALKAGNMHIDHIEITASNVHSWPSESPLTQRMGLTLDKGRSGGVRAGDIIWLAQRKKIAEGGWTQLGRLRVAIMEALVAKGLMTLPKQPHFLWITQFPLFTQADEDKAHLAKGRWASTHHPFTAPMWEDMAELKKGNVAPVRGQHYDLVLNGQEIGGGSVRIHDADLQEYVMREVLKLDESEMGRFGHLLQALKFGAPPHGGIALGFDRLVAILCGAKSIREVIAFPKSATGQDPVFKSPSTVAEDVLQEYNLRPIKPQPTKPKTE